MAEQIINNGASAGDPTAENIYTSFEKAKDNFSELYTTVAGLLAKAGGIMTGVLQFANGTVGAPSAKVGSDQKGLYHVDTDKLGLSIAGAKVGEFNSNGYAGLTNRIILQDRKAVNTAGGDSISGDNDRDLNTVLYNGITDSSLASNQITLPVGRYYIKKISSFCIAGNSNKLKFYNVTSSAIQTDINANEIVGDSSYMPSGDNVAGYTNLSGYYFDVVTTPKVFKIIHSIQSGATNGLGVPSNLSSPEIYTNVEIEKVG